MWRGIHLFWADFCSIQLEVNQYIFIRSSFHLSHPLIRAQRATRMTGGSVASKSLSFILQYLAIYRGANPISPITSSSSSYSFQSPAYPLSCISFHSPMCGWSGWSGCRTGNGEKLSNSQVCCLFQLCLDAAQFLSVSCVTSTLSTLYKYQSLLFSLNDSNTQSSVCQIASKLPCRDDYKE